MSKQQIKQLIESRIDEDGLTETSIKGVKLFRATAPIPCAPAVYEPSVIAIVSGAKEAVLDGERYVYDDSRYLCCPMSMPVQAGTPAASPDNPLYGVYVSLDQRVMTELIIEMERAGVSISMGKGSPISQGFSFAQWDAAFSDALLRLLQLGKHQTDVAVLGEARLRELYYAILKGEAGMFASQAFGTGNAIARSIAYMSLHLNEPITIDEMAQRAGMSRAVFHRKFKQATTMSPIQFVKSMRLNNAAMKIAGGMTVTEAAMEVGYLSASQFSREFKRMYGQSPRQWSDAQHLPSGMA
ncbi:AraC family transcriptional regulator [filamentous cyanobacterium LEGE 11480]|uniref:AraC family transcriptional regulator n=1 Tax=Romeriopsis navalis LEGE 11480 TaxID=2777977 RepID=A0A928Z3I2_9CYAN|nr:AraC family transcriptional regulator [Romeriopsis navalis]MBE9029330.1 AraC family transcriptional regulator [Romeriopsis navalis LEGE 11480]